MNLNVIRNDQRIINIDFWITEKNKTYSAQRFRSCAFLHMLLFRCAILFFFSSLISIVFSFQWYHVIGFWNINLPSYWNSNGANGPHLTQYLKKRFFGNIFLLNFNQHKISFSMTDSMIGFWNMEFLTNWNNYKKGVSFQRSCPNMLKVFEAGVSPWALYIPNLYENRLDQSLFLVWPLVYWTTNVHHDLIMQ